MLTYKCHKNIYLNTEVIIYLITEREQYITPKEKVEKYQGLTFINIYEKENDKTTINRFKRDMLNILSTTEK